MAMDTKDETIQEASVADEIKPDKNIKEVIEQATNNEVQEKTSEPVVKEPAPINKVEEVKEEPDPLTVIEDVSDETKVEETTEDKKADVPKKKKAPLIILLSILLIIDVAALVIYIIGIDKILSFIK